MAAARATPGSLDPVSVHGWNGLDMVDDDAGSGLFLDGAEKVTKM